MVTINNLILKIIEAGVDNNQHKLANYSKKLASVFEEKGNKITSSKILNIINSNNLNSVSLDSLATKPIDKEGHLEMVDVSIPSEGLEPLFFNQAIENEVNSFINMYKKREKIIEKGIDLRHNLLLYGLPGTGKTSIAKYISYQTNLPLITVQLDSLISSLLGNTAKNLNKVFQYASNQPCILFLDEFDVIGKKRDDKHELGELKRIVNSLLQNIDTFDDDKIIIAATNHDFLLDDAIWRRFNVVLDIELPNKQVRETFIKDLSSRINNNFDKSKTILSNIIDLTEGFSPATIKDIFSSASIKSILDDEEILRYSYLIKEIYMHNNPNGGNRDDLIAFLLKNKVTQKEIKHALNISEREIRKISKEVKANG